MLPESILCRSPRQNLLFVHLRRETGARHPPRSIWQKRTAQERRAPGQTQIQSEGFKRSKERTVSDGSPITPYTPFSEAEYPRPQEIKACSQRSVFAFCQKGGSATNAAPRIHVCN